MIRPYTRNIPLLEKTGTVVATKYSSLIVNLFLQVKTLAREVYDKHFRAACATPRGVVAKLCNIVAQLDEACRKHSTQYEKVGDLIHQVRLI